LNKPGPDITCQGFLFSSQVPENKSQPQSPYAVMTSHHILSYPWVEAKNETSDFEIHPNKRHRMSEIPAPMKAHPEPELYEIRVRGHLDTRWANRLESLTIRLEENGDTLLTGPVIDQAALHGLLKKIRDLGMPLVSVNRIQFNETHSYRSIIGENMNSSATPTKKIDPKTLLSTLWIVVMINMLKADILSLFIPGATDELAKTSASTSTPIPQLMLGGAIMMEIFISMIVLSRVLKYSVNRWVNIIVSLITIAFVVGGGVSYPHYIFIATVEVICLLLIIWNAWKWRNVEA
jgi:hypothetical protein